MEGTGKQTTLALAEGSVALAGFGLSRVRCAGDCSGSKGNRSGDRAVSLS